MSEEQSRIVSGGAAGGGKTDEQLTLREEIPGGLGLAIIKIDLARMKKLAGVGMPPDVFREWAERSKEEIQRSWRKLQPGDLFIHSDAISVKLLPALGVIADWKPVTATEPAECQTCIVAGSPDVALAIAHRAKGDTEGDPEGWWMETSIAYERIEPPLLFMPAPIVPVESEEKE